MKVGVAPYTVHIYGLAHTLRWRHNGLDSVPNHQPHDCLLKRLFGRRSKKTSKLIVTGLCAGIQRGPVNSPHKGPVTRKMFSFDDVIMVDALTIRYTHMNICYIWHLNDSIRENTFVCRLNTVSHLSRPYSVTNILCKNSRSTARSRQISSVILGDGVWFTKHFQNHWQPRKCMWEVGRVGASYGSDHFHRSRS